MAEQPITSSQLYSFLPTDIEGVEALIELALDLRWSWDHKADRIWQHLDPALWEATHNPWIVLQTISRNQLERQLADSYFRRNINDLINEKQLQSSAPAWFQQSHMNSPLNCITYFSMEFMLSEALPIYVGGLGNVAGDQLKSASDLGVPIVGVGLLYQQGYYRQEIDQNGSQEALFPYNDPMQLPIKPLRLPDGEWLRLKIELPGYPVWLRAWQVQVGRLQLYLLDCNDAANLPVYRQITNELYGGGPDTRIKQEILLGIGGWRLLHRLGLKPEVCHLNEGHAAFVILERANDFMKETGVSFEEALTVTRAGNLFTTHTAVAAGFDHFSPGLMKQFLGKYAQDELGISFSELMALGRQDGQNNEEPFNMAYLAFRGSGAVNGVSQLHGHISRHLFEPLFPRWPTSEVPVGAVTNGVHMPGWDSEFADELWTQSSGKERWRGDLERLEQDINQLPDAALWQLRNCCRTDLVQFIRKRLEQQLTVAGFPSTMIEAARQAFNADTLTLGFARRFVPYKRPNLLLHDPQRLIRILTNEQHPVQLVIAGKAPPFDEAGKALVQQWVQFIMQHLLFHHVVFLSDYDMLLTEQLVQGVDLWINTPRRPWEACGTSGMKVLVNGGLNLSELDGWWAEAYSPEVGWALGDGQEHGDDPAWDTAEAETLYQLLEQQVVPDFYSRNAADIPERWIKKIRASMATLTPQFSANRTVREYTESYYLPMAANYQQRAADKGELGKRIRNIQNELKSKWNGIRFGKVKVESTEKGYLFIVIVLLNAMNPRMIVVELYANGINGPAERIKMQEQTVANNHYVYKAEVKTERPASDYTVRIIPSPENVSIPLENNLILWQH